MNSRARVRTFEFGKGVVRSISNENLLVELISVAPGQGSYLLTSAEGGEVQKAEHMQKVSLYLSSEEHLQDGRSLRAIFPCNNRS